VTNAGKATAGPQIRAFRTLEEYRACVALQEATWGEGFSERVPTAILHVAQRLGGVAAGAFDESGRLVGFVFGMTGVDEGGVVHWSDMLAVRPAERDSGLGRRLKAHQREVLLARGVTRMLWTFDPLQSRNAYLNLKKLGAVAREYVRDMYGDTDSPLHRGIGTDRLVALWLMDTERVRTRLTGGARRPSPGLTDAAPALGVAPRSGTTHARPGHERPGLDESVVSIAIPADVDELMRDDAALAAAWRQATRRVLERYLERGYEVRELVRDGDVSHYLLMERNLDED
jgi:predicted GNAT superfamily acetyltransferase